MRCSRRFYMHRKNSALMTAVAVFMAAAMVCSCFAVVPADEIAAEPEKNDPSLFGGFDILSKLEALGIAHLVNEMPAELSGGELKRASIVRALVNKPDIVIADEPTSNLDEGNGKKVFDLFAEIVHSGTSVIVATHDTRGFKYGDRLYTMHKGQLLPNGESDYGGL